MSALLEIDSVAVSFGGLRAVGGFSLRLEAGALCGLIGPNGAGKTTVFNLLTGVYRPQSGSMRLAGRELNGLRPFEIAQAGMARTFQNIRLFPRLSALDNVRIAGHLHVRHGMLAAVWRSARHLAEERELCERALRLLDTFGLAARAEDEAGSLPYGDQRRLEIARALASRPKVLLLDEPAAGMNSTEKQELRRLIQKLRDEHAVAILLIEHDMGVVMDLCSRITVLDHGVIIAEGTPAEIQRDPKVIEAYLGAPVAANGKARA